VIRPQTRAEAKRREFIKNLKKGDIVFLSSGIVGRVSEIYQKTVSLEISKDVKIRVLKDSIQGPFLEKDEPQEKQTEKKD
jgi:preprotein translocase subunit YajC